MDKIELIISFSLVGMFIGIICYVGNFVNLIMSDKIGIIITARMTGNRFPNKVLAKFRGKPIIEHVLINAEKLGYPVVIAIPEKSDNDALETWCKDEGVLYYRGVEHQVILRVLECAKKHKFDIIIKLGADSPDTRPEDIRENLDKFLKEGKKRMIWGQNSFIFTTDMLEEVEKNSIHAVNREHCGFQWMTNTIDYPEDILRLE